MDFTNIQSSLEYMTNESEKIIIETFDALEIGHYHSKFHLTDNNHIFINFLPMLIIDDFDTVLKTVRNIIFKYGIKLWKCKMEQAELKFKIKYFTYKKK